jgi:anti-sigma factor RsiW
MSGAASSMAGSPCRRILPLLEAFGDGELESDKILEVEQHLVECRVCTERVRLSQALRVSTRRAVTAEAMPSQAFAERLTLALAAERRRESERQQASEREARGKLLPWRVIVPVAAAAAFTLVWAASTSDRSPAVRTAAIGKGGDTLGTIASVEELVDELVAYHASALEPQVTEPKLVAQLEPEIGMPLRVPSLQQYGGRWEGASVVPMRNQRAASLRYHVGDHRVTIYVYDSNRFPLRAMLEPRVVRNKPVYVGSRRGYSIAASEQRGVGHAVATDLGDRESAELIASIEKL